MTDERDVTLQVNGALYTLRLEPRMLLSEVLRHQIGLTGTHVGCEHGVCGACTILVDGLPARSCLMFAVQAQGRDLKTVESLSANGALHPLQEAFRDCHALQCGYCTPGVLMSMAAFLDETPMPDEDSVRDMLSGHLCRCTGYQNIVDAVMLAARRMAEAR